MQALQTPQTRTSRSRPLKLALEAVEGGGGEGAEEEERWGQEALF